MPSFDFLQAQITALQQAGRWRSRPAPRGCDVMVACSNDYLGYAARSDAELLGPAGAAGSRLVTGDAPQHLLLEAAVAQWTQHQAALVFSSGYAANVGMISALAAPEDLIVSDQLNHASIIDGCRLSRANVQVVAHGDLSAMASALQLPARRKWLVTESYFSMDGLVADLPRIRAVADASGAMLLVDEAHALGVFGQSGAGLCEQMSVRADVVVGTFGKALGLQGAFVASQAPAIEWLWNRARSFVFSTGMSPALCAAAEQNVSRARRDAEGRTRLWSNAQRLRDALLGAGVRVVPESIGPIVPVLVGDDHRAVECEQRLLAKGFYVRAIRPPTVALGTARLRVTVNAPMTESQLAALSEALGEIVA
jgi:8-amino-7-oxononanoate synthase